ncbi:MAG: HD domain-containing protein [Thermoplasmata archaeon]|nr:HD domain-containing protein [Thermoplasmata archaeon]
MTVDGRYKIIHDTVHGSVRVEGVILDLLSTPEITRLSNIKQLGTTYLVFPGANHTRFEHSLGASVVAHRMAKILGLEEEERMRVEAAALLHDIGHSAFSHVLEGAIRERQGMDHMEITKRLIRGEEVPGWGREEGWGRIPDILERAGISPGEVADLVTGDSSPENTLKLWYQPGMDHFSGEERYLHQMIHGVVDVDQIDYLMRDSHYTGVAHGAIDLARLLNTLEVFRGDLVVNVKGVPAVEGMLVARSLMYVSVYFHKTGRIAQEMLSRALERCTADVSEISGMVDWEFLFWLRRQGDFQSEVAERIKYRRLYKPVYTKRAAEMTEEEREFFHDLANPRARREMEDELARKTGLDPGGVIVDIPLPDLLASEPRINWSGIKVSDGETLHPISDYSSISEAVRRGTQGLWAAIVSCPGDHVGKVREALAAAMR